MASLAQYWPNPNGVTVSLVNGGSPIYLDTGIGSGDSNSQLEAAKAGLVAANLRGVADIVLFFSPYVTNTCGHSPMTNWNINGRHAFIPNASGLDLDGADLYYAGIVSVPSCPAETALHEFGHLFSAGHATTGPAAAPAGAYLLPNNHAYWISFTYPYQYLSSKTIMAQGGIGGYQRWCFSGSACGGTTGTDNFSGLAYTALSLANYRNGVADTTAETDQCSDGLDNDGNGPADYPSDAGCSGPSDSQEYSVPEVPSCGLTPPILVSGILTGVCVPSYPYTSHLLSWIDVCPSAKTHYKVWYNQFGWDVFGWNTLIPINNIYVYGANATMRIKSCNGPVCSSLSADSYYAYSQC